MQGVQDFEFLEIRKVLEIVKERYMCITERRILILKM